MGRRRDIAFSLALALLLGLTMCACIIQIGVERVPHIAGPSTGAMVALVSTVIAIVAFPCALALLRKGPALVERVGAGNPLPKLRLQFDARSIAVCAAIILACWIPWLVLQFPGAVNTDAMHQIYEFQAPAPTAYSGQLVDAEFIDHHPVFDTLIYGAFLEVGKVFGSQNTGLFLFAVVQSVLTALALAACCCYLARISVPKVFRLLTLAFFALVPLFPLYAATMVKDSTFSAVFAWWFIMFVEVFRSRGNALKRWSFTVWLAVATLLCLATKKPGLVVTVPGMLAMLALYRTYWKQMLTAVAAPLVVFLGLVPAVVYPLIGGVAPGGSEELFGVMYQQVVGVMKEAEDQAGAPGANADGAADTTRPAGRADLSASELAAVDAVLDIDAAMSSYSPSTTDDVKAHRRTGAQPQDHVAFLGAYLSIGLRHPLEYTNAVLLMNGSFLAPGKAMTYYHTDEMPSTVPASMRLPLESGWTYELTKPEPVRTWSTQVHDAYMDAVSSNPLLALLLGRGLYAGWVPLICCLLACSRDRRYVLAFVPILLSMLVLLAGPMSSARYALHLMYVTPLMLGLLCNALATERRVPDHIRRDSPSANVAGSDGGGHDTVHQPETAEPAQWRVPRGRVRGQ